MRTIVVDGVTYIPKQPDGPFKIVVIERGFVYVGRVEASDADTIMYGARCLIRWGSSQHLGELVNGPLSETKMGAPCTVRVRNTQIIHTIEVNQDAWAKYITS